MNTISPKELKVEMIEPGVGVTWKKLPEDDVRLVTRKDENVYSLRNEDEYCGVLIVESRTEIYYQSVDPKRPTESSPELITNLRIIKEPNGFSSLARSSDVSPVIDQSVMEKLDEWVDEKPFFNSDKRPISEFLEHSFEYRPPTRDEKRELAKTETELMYGSSEDIADEAKDLVRSANLVVIDSYTSGSPGYCGRLLLAVYGYPGTYTLYKDDMESDDLSWERVQREAQV